MTQDQRPTTVSPGWQSTASKEMILRRALMLKNIRAFFDARAVIEVETPLLSHHSTTDPHLDSLSTSFREQVCYLNTSPEYAMKRLIADHQQAIYQICKAFRDDELGPNHNPEFTMLEWYRPEYGMAQLMDELSELVAALFNESSNNDSNNNVLTVKPAFERLSYHQAFESTTGIDPHQTTSDECCQFSLDNDVEVPQGLTTEDDVDDWLDWLLTQRVLPAFKKDGFTFLYDYPASQCALAKIENNAGQVAVAKRFELFYGEVELANGFFELTDADEQLSRFQQENQRRTQAGKTPAPIDENFIAALSYGMPVCSGVAVGLDRLLMVLSQSENIEQVLSFAWRNA